MLDPETQTKSIEKSTAITKIEYDSNGNWIKSERFMPSKTGDDLITTSLVERIITYY
ncbi:MAG: hypothetical protein ACR2N3_04590 [Pyrinomonadaceae bacterium]